MLDYLEFPDGGRGEEAQPSLQEAVSHRTPAEGEFREAEQLYYNGEFGLAAEAFGRARRHDPALFDAWANEAEGYLRAGDLAKAGAAALEAIETYGRVPVFYAARAIVLAHEGYLEEAYQHSDVSVQHQDASAFTWLSRAEVLLSGDQPGILRSVEACFEKAAQRDPSRWRSTFRAALILLQWGKAGRALERLEHVVAIVPENACAWKLQGDCLRLQGKDPAARSCYQMALARRPDYPAAAQALQRMTLWGRIRQWFRRG
ncbi:hypothetical protein HQ560_05170 [bacterium]|nr:hypothetical protein [bacterium]